MTDLYPIINIGTAENPTMAMCATTMMMVYEAETGKKYDPDTVEDYINFVNDYRDEYNVNLKKSYDSLSDETKKDWGPWDRFKLYKVMEED